MDRYQSAKRVSLFGIIGNIFLLIIKAIIGFLSHSQSMIADAANSASDIFASLMTFIGNKISSEPSDKTHNFGHGKAEYIFSFLISLSMILVSIKLLIDSVSSLINRNEFIFSWFLVLVCIITIIIKLTLYLYSHSIVKKYNNILVKANMKDHRNDCIVTTFTLISILASLFGIYWIDGIVGIGISLWIAFTGVKIFIESYNILMDISLDENTTKLIYDLAHGYKEIQKVDPISSTPVGYQYVVTLTIYVDGNMSTFKSHELADHLEKDINKLENIYHTIIHVNPI
ncbi:MAG TPA: cation transporter [Candidatus Merdicola faecigallinarum]|uniref:Cation transporter n=1 Tax=Candidatus Merdicola faecigallinarum TaxID=2840862 RepID=A0A9D1M071_9FIRM|nr:cation transporter [Candidatus Merdicola faecigallinarum]